MDIKVYRKGVEHRCSRRPTSSAAKLVLLHSDRRCWLPWRALGMGFHQPALFVSMLKVSLLLILVLPGWVDVKAKIARSLLGHVTLSKRLQRGPATHEAASPEGAACIIDGALKVVLIALIFREGRHNAMRVSCVRALVRVQTLMAPSAVLSDETAPKMASQIQGDFEFKCLRFAFQLSISCCYNFHRSWRNATWNCVFVFLFILIG